ncbi:MAG: hypothetical protein EA442_01535 [Candidatus Nitrosopelagicus sp.]|nr:MAG: hypothetical protein EA442_01535 [Candidatus Nitrosopelagicus sp.]
MYIQIPNSNWNLPVQLCNFMQNELDIPIQTIDWGHPNIRDGKMMEYKEGKLLSAFREHQLKIFSDQFKRVPMKFIHKKKLLSELIKYNNLLKIDSSKFCMPPKQITSNQVKVFHDAENSDKLPQELKGKHFDAFWQICWVMGCDRCEGSKNDPISEAIFLSGKSELQSLECEQSRISKIRQDTTQKLEPIWKKIQSKIKSKVKRKKSSFTEADTYEPQKKWLQKYLEKKYPNSKIETFVVADSDMSSFFTRMGNEQHADLMEEYDIRPDVVGIIDGDKLAFIESKITQLGIKEIGQLLGYCLVSEPEIAILCSTKESSGKLTTILPHQELFEYGKNAKIQCATWSQNKGTMDFLGET